MSGWRASLAVLLVFLAGAISGGAAVYLARIRAERQIVSSPEPVIQLVIAALDRDLDLSDGQKGAIREVLLQGRAEILTTHPELMPELVELFERTQTRIGETLTPEQRATYAQLVEQRRRLLDEVRRTSESQPK